MISETDAVLAIDCLAKPSFYRILAHIAAHPGVGVNDLCEGLGMAQPSVSRCLALLRAADLVRSDRVGHRSHSRIRADRIEGLIEHLRGTFCKEEAACPAEVRA